MNFFPKKVTLIFATLSALCAQSEIIMPRIFGNGMVLQQGKRVTVWGTSNPSSEVIVRFGNTSAKARSNARGEWKVNLGAMKADKTGRKLLVTSGADKIEFNDVLVGEVWYCSGQSNMRMMVKESNTSGVTLKEKHTGDIRFIDFTTELYPNAGRFDVAKLESIEKDPEEYYKTEGWKKATDSTSLANMSAVAFYFGSKLHEQLEVPIGLIHTAIGGAPIEAYISSKSLSTLPELKNLAENWIDAKNYSSWCQGRAKNNLGNWISAGKKGFPHPFVPGFLNKAGVTPIAPYSIRGFLWYQGESNCPINGTGTAGYTGGFDIDQNRKALELLVKDWRGLWSDKNNSMPFYHVQLPGMNRPWPLFREMQIESQKAIANSGVVVTYDSGHPTDVHPRDKKIVGDRLGLLALGKTYNKNITYASPVFDSASVRGTK
ncbi:MAG: hypothetical protein ACRC37_07905, partial [Lentisphaeria bacterium]